MLRSDHSAFSSRPPFLPWVRLGLGLVTAALALGCTPKIGDDCTVSTNCSTTGDRLCDVTQPGGYCTKFNCEPGGCTDDSVCVNFGTSLSPVAGCESSQANSPYRRSFCMANCSSDGDCRSGYSCQSAKDFGAVLAEHDSSQRVCAVSPRTIAKTDAGAENPDAGLESNSNEVCIGSDAGPPAEGGGSSTGGSGASGANQGGTSGVGGEGGSSGSAGDSAAGDGGTGG